MPGKTMTPSAPLTQLQGVEAPNLYVDPVSFYGATRKMSFPMASKSKIAGLGSSDPVRLRQTGIVSALEVRISGTVVFGGTITGTSLSYLWPFGVVNQFKLSANGQSNLIQATGLKIRAYEFAALGDLQEFAISQPYGAGTQSQGNLALPCDDWGTSSSNHLGPGSTVPAAGTYTFDITYVIPVAANMVSLIGSVYAQTQATNLALEIQYETLSNLVTLGGAATADFSNLTYDVTGIAYSIPQVGGRFVIPDLTVFHQLAEQRAGGLTGGDNTFMLPGTGAGRKLMRVFWNTYSGTAPGVPVIPTEANVATVAWMYGGNDQPEVYASGQKLRARNVRQFGVDLAVAFGILCWDFASENALRDLVDEGATSDLRILWNLVSSSTNGYAQVLQETLFAAPVGA